MKKNILTIDLSLLGPILTQSSEPGDFGLDIVVARTQDNVPYIPGTLLSGKLDQAWQEIYDATSSSSSFRADVGRLLGKPNENGIPLRKQLFFSDLLLTEMVTGEFVHHRVGIDEQRGAADKQQLVSIENPFLQGREYVFSGTVTFFSTHDEHDTILKEVKTGLRWLSQVGGMRTIGYGRVKEIAFPPVKSFSVPQPSPLTNIPTKIGLVVKPAHPFCLPATPVADNLFESDEIIPGAALVGSIVTTWTNFTGKQSGTVSDIRDESRSNLKKYFNALRITHAFPSVFQNKRPVVYPKSLVTVIKEKGSFYDVANCDKACLIKGKVPAFPIDWKDDSNVKKEFGWSQVQKELRIRTGIDPDSLRASENELFSYEQIQPGDHSWYAELDLGAIPEEMKNKVFSELRSLLEHGIIGLGKTKTPAAIEFVVEPAVSIEPVKLSSLEPINTNQWIITLQSDTLLGSPEHLNETSGVKELKKMYETAWDDLSDTNLKLVRYFADQRLSGGIWRRKTMQKERMYRPWLLSGAGSVFVLEATGAISTAKTIIEEWFHHGLPLKGAVFDYYTIDPDPLLAWRNCPYIPQNGYGEIAVNLDVHTINFPSKLTWIKDLEEEESGNGA